MARLERDKVSGQMTTGHEWNGIKELNTPVPRVLWGAIILLLTLLSLGTALIGLIIIFPLLGHATWHAYAAVRD